MGDHRLTRHSRESRHDGNANVRKRPIADITTNPKQELMTQPLRHNVCRILLFVALLPTVFVTLALFATGIWFSPLEHPFAALFALIVASAPIWVLRAIILSSDEGSGRRVALHTMAIWAAILFYVLFVFGWLPKPIYYGWQWLVA